MKVKLAHKVVTAIAIPVIPEMTIDQIVSEALRRANIFSPDEDPLNVQDVQTILRDSHGWKPVGDNRNDPANTPSIETQVLEPGDVILGYRDGENGRSLICSVGAS